MSLSTLKAQKLIRGVVLDAEKNAPIPKASVFLNNTSVGTTANEEGKFELSIPAGRFELIVSSVGYQTQSLTIAAAEGSNFYTIKLPVKAPDLEEIIIEPYEKNGWEKWGKWFTENFLGTSEYGQDCRIKNPDVLKFRNSKRTNDLTVTATAPLIVENKALGYRVSYQLENFHYDFSTHYLFYAGYPFFEQMKGGEGKRREWEKRRADAYSGSLLQFMRALYRNRIAEEGFEVRRLLKISNAEKARIKWLYKTGVPLKQDSTAYYDHVMKQDDFKNIIGKDLLPGDSIAYGIDSTTVGFEFPNHLLVIYKNKKNPVGFKRLYPHSGDIVMSEITMLNNRPLQVFANGSYFHPEDLLSNGYWGWWEKMGTTLPLDYAPPKKGAAQKF
jgi:hypothetical protein